MADGLLFEAAGWVYEVGLADLKKRIDRQLKVRFVIWVRERGPAIASAAKATERRWATLSLASTYSGSPTAALAPRLGARCVTVSEQRRKPRGGFTVG
jgi:hypothetical protein